MLFIQTPLICDFKKNNSLLSKCILQPHDRTVFVILQYSSFIFPLHKKARGIRKLEAWRRHPREGAKTWDAVAARRLAVDIDTLPRDVDATHLNLNDGTLEGMCHRGLRLFSVQYHPEASAGPHDSTYLFEEFRSLVG